MGHISTSHHLNLYPGPFPSPWVYSAHHVNAYEESETEIVLDMVPTPFHNMREYLKLDNMLNPPGKDDPDWLDLTRELREGG